MINNFFAIIIILSGFYSLGVTENRLEDAAYIAVSLVVIMVLTQLVLTVFEYRFQDLIVLASVLVAVGLMMQFRISPDVALLQLKWCAIAYIASCVLVIFTPSYKRLADFKYSFAFLGLFAMLSPILFGVERNGSKLWLKLGSLTFQPAEVSKLMLAVFFAGYLAERHQLLSKAMRDIGPFSLPKLRYFGPVAMMWLISIVVLVLEKDLGSSLLFFSLFMILLYVATGKLIYPAIGGAMFALGSFASFLLFSHLRTRIDIWINPWSDPSGKGFQVIQSMIAFATGGLFGGGLGQGEAGVIPAVTTDFIFSAIGEETGMIGTIGIVLLFLLIISRGMRIAVETKNTFGKLLAVALTTSLGFQAFVIIAGVTKLAPLTGVTLPFISYGGSSLLANLLLIGLLVKITTENHEHEH